MKLFKSLMIYFCSQSSCERELQLTNSGKRIGKHHSIPVQQKWHDGVIFRNSSISSSDYCTEITDKRPFIYLLQHVQMNNFWWEVQPLGPLQHLHDIWLPKRFPIYNKSQIFQLISKIKMNTPIESERALGFFYFLGNRTNSESHNLTAKSSWEVEITLDSL